jgi:tetratricopeptide (TPR) repeat protein
MKIGSLDIGVKTLTLAAGLVVALMVDVKLFATNYSQWSEGRLSRRIQLCFIPGTDVERRNGVEYCQNLLNALPRCASAGLYLGTFQYNLKQYAEARKAYEAVTQQGGASAEQRAMAFVGVGAAVFMGRPERERVQAAEEAEKWFRKALETDKNLADAKVGLAITTLWAGKPTAADEAHTLLKEALASKPPPGRDGMAQLYNALGVVLAAKQQPVEAESAFESALAIIPQDWNLPRQNQMRTMVTLLGLPGLRLSLREPLLVKYETRIGEFGGDALLAMNSFAVGWWRTKADLRGADFMARCYPRALVLLREAMKRSTDTAMSFQNAVAIYEDQLFERETGLVLQLQPEFFDPCPVERAVNPWTGAAPPAAAARAEFQSLLRDIYSIALAEKLVLVELTSGRVRLDVPTLVDAKLRLLTCQLLIALTCLNDPERVAGLAELTRQAEALKAQAADDPRVLRAFAHAMLRARRYGEACQALRTAREKGDAGEDLKRILEQIETPPQFLDIRPRKSRWFGQRPLVSATILAPHSPGGLGGGLTVDGRKVESALSGAQLLYLLPEGLLSDGTHKIEFQASDGYGNAATQAVDFYIDRLPPKIALEPKDDQPVKGPRPVWTVELNDPASGVDLGSLQVQLSNQGEGAIPIRLIIIQQGVYRCELPNLNVKINDKVPGEKFRVAPDRDLTAGVYALKITVLDKAGNKKDETRSYRVSE